MQDVTDVLVVEDHPADAALIREVFASDYDVEIAADGETAISTLEQTASRDERPALVLLDLRLPDIPGFEILDQVSECFADTSFVVCTNSDSDRDRKRADELGADEYVTKPMDIDEFQREIRTIERTFLQAGG